MSTIVMDICFLEMRVEQREQDSRWHVTLPCLGSRVNMGCSRALMTVYKDESLLDCFQKHASIVQIGLIGSIVLSRTWDIAHEFIHSAVESILFTELLEFIVSLKVVVHILAIRGIIK